MTTKGVLRDRACGMRKEPSRAERALWDLLRGRQVRGLKFRRQHPIAPYIADFACEEAKVVVEVDGRSHDDGSKLRTMPHARRRSQSKAGASCASAMTRCWPILKP